MARRLLVLLLNTAIVLSAVAGAVCPARAGCMMGRAQRAQCCAAAKPGISAPRCCPGTQQLSRIDMAPAAQRPLLEGHTLVAAHETAWLAVWSGVRLLAAPPPGDAGAAPPGRTLIAQHTSLLL